MTARAGSLAGVVVLAALLQPAGSAVAEGAAGDAASAPVRRGEVKASPRYSLRTQALCRDGVERDLEVRLEGLSESTTLCGRNQIAEPQWDWSCERADPPKALGPCRASEPPSPLCGTASRCRGGFVRCLHAYRCRPETPDYNREALRQKRQARLRAEFSRLQGSAGRASRAASCSAFPERLSHCIAFHCREPHPTLGTLWIERSVVGLDGEVCVFREKVQSGLALECRMDDASRSSYASRVLEQRSNPEPPREGEPPLDLAAAALASADCQPTANQ